MTIHAELQAVADAMAKAYNAQDAAGCAALFTPDAELHSPYAPPARSRADIEALHRVWTEGGSDKSFTVLDAGRSGDLAWCLLSFAEGPVTSEGTSLCVMARQPDEAWLIRMCCLHGG